MRILVCGSRHFNDYNFMYRTIAAMFDPDDTLTLIHGDARGADRLAEAVFLSGYFHSSPEYKRFPADWSKYGKAAGPIRNKQMLDEGKPDLVIAFLGPNSRGTQNMIDQARRAGVPVEIIPIPAPTS